MELPHGVAGEGDDATDIVFPTRKAVVDGKSGRKSSTPGRKDKNDLRTKSPLTSKLVSSPKRRRASPVTDISRTPLQSGVAKLTEASVRYHPDKDSVLKRGFAGEGLTPPELREMLRRLFLVKLTEPELSAVFAHFVPDGGMELDGNVFIVRFIQVCGVLFARHVMLSV